MTDLVCPLPHKHDSERPRRPADGVRVCWGHRSGFVDDLKALPVLNDELASHLSRSGGDPGDRSSDEVGISLDPAVVAARDHIRVTLVSWTRITLEEGPWKHAPDDTIPAITAWLLRRCDWLLNQDWTPEFVDNVRTTVRESRALIQPNTTYRIELGPCPEPVVILHPDTAEPGIECCPGTIIAVMRKASSREQLPSEVLCSAHGEDEENPHVWTPMQWHALGRRMGRSNHPDAAAAFMRAFSG